jgi:hypothetical protein
VNLPPASVPFLAATLLLGAAGVAKALRPATTVNALRVAGASVPARWVRAGALAELVIAVLAILVPGLVTGLLVALTYAGFAAFMVVALQRHWPLGSCGCFGRPDTPPTAAHAALNVGAAASALWWALAWLGRGGFVHLARLFSHQAWHGAPLMFLIVVVTGLAYLVWTDPVPAVRR